MRRGDGAERRWSRVATSLAFSLSATTIIPIEVGDKRSSIKRSAAPRPNSARMTSRGAPNRYEDPRKYARP